MFVCQKNVNKLSRAVLFNLGSVIILYLTLFWGFYVGSAKRSKMIQRFRDLKRFKKTEVDNRFSKHFLNEKTALKMLVKLRPGVNFINILRARFSYRILVPKIKKLCFGCVKCWWNWNWCQFYQDFTHKFFVRKSFLTTFL
jgi:hypothetical protein